MLTSGVTSFAVISSRVRTATPGAARRLALRLALRLGVSVAAVVAGLTACGSEKPPATSTVSMGAPVGVRPPAPGDPSCPRTGKWQPCALEDRVVHAGLSFKATGDSARVPFFKVPGVRYRVALTDTLLAFFFADSAALDRAVTTLDTLRMAPVGDTALPWPSLPNVIRSGNLLGLYVAESPRQIERLRLANTAGAPAPPDSAHGGGAKGAAVPVMLPPMPSRR